METADAKELVRSPRHPYTRALISAVPVIDQENRRQRIVLAGDMPSPIQPPSGCPFHPRCPIAISECQTTPQHLRTLAPGHEAACALAK